MSTSISKDELSKFKNLLQYFVVHLEYCQYQYNSKTSKQEQPNWFEESIEGKYVATIVKKTGQGYLNNAIQQQIEEWANYPWGRVSISVQCERKGAYTTKASYLHWDKTGLNINAHWTKDNDDDIIDYLYYRNYYKEDDISSDIQVSRKDLFSDNNDSIQKVFNAFVEAKKNCLNDMIRMISARLSNSYNLVLTGAPGTGKTHMTEDIARILVGLNKDDSLAKSQQYCFVQFHPSYDYTDFVEGLRPMMQDGGIVFKRQDGIFKAFCDKAIKDKNKDNKYVFVIDEINRGEISKILGELFFSIDPGYRGDKMNPDSIRKVSTQYQAIIDIDSELSDDNYSFKKGFFVPDNVYLIGTMNDIDRSVESMDFAFRRRFSFIEITAEESESMIYSQAWDDDVKNNAIQRMQQLNMAIIDPQIGRLTEQYKIGAAYFLNLKKLKFDFDRLWNESLRGLLYEYYRGQPDANEIVSKLKDAYDLKSNGKK